MPANKIGIPNPQTQTVAKPTTEAVIPTIHKHISTTQLPGYTAISPIILLIKQKLEHKQENKKGTDSIEKQELIIINTRSIIRYIYFSYILILLFFVALSY
jgi:hypothetical protein